MTHKQLSDITGVELCASKKTNIIDPTPAEVYDMMEERFPECAEWLRETIPGETVYIRSSPNKRAAVMRWDDGIRTAAEVARLAGCSVSTVKRVRQDSA